MALLRPKTATHRESGDIPVEFWLSISDVMTGLVMVFVLSFLAVLAHKSGQLARQEHAAVQKQEEIDLLRERIRRTLGVREDLIRALRDRFREVKGQVTVDPKTGALRIGESVLFAFNSDRLRDEGKAVVLEVYGKLSAVLFSDRNVYENYLSDIAIEGHASRETPVDLAPAVERASYLANLDLSQRRAQAVLALLSRAETVDQVLLRRFTVAIGYGYSRLRDANNPQAEANRRIEITFRLKDEEALKSMRELLEGQRR